MDFKQSPKLGPATDGTIMMRKGPFKLSYLFGNKKYYSKLDGNQYFELFDIEEDPEELINLFDRSDPVTRDLIDELNTKLSEKNLLSENINLKPNDI